MLTILKHKQNTIYYKCSCGTQGMCSVKPGDEGAALVVNVRCPACGETERVVLLQYDSCGQREDLLDNIDSLDLTWVPTLNEEI